MNHLILSDIIIIYIAVAMVALKSSNQTKTDESHISIKYYNSQCSGHGGSRVRSSAVPRRLQQCDHPAGAEVGKLVFLCIFVLLYYINPKCVSLYFCTIVQLYIQ